MIARDGASPPRTSNAVQVTINILRNNNPPVFVNEPYSTSVTSAVSAGISLFSVTATDADTRVSRCAGADRAHDGDNVYSTQRRHHDWAAYAQGIGLGGCGDGGGDDDDDDVVVVDDDDGNGN